MVGGAGVDCTPPPTEDEEEGFVGEETVDEEDVLSSGVPSELLLATKTIAL